MTLLEKYIAHIKKEDLFHPKDKLLLAVSGGVDSVVMCELCKQAGYDFVMAHCNFQLRGEESDKDESFVQDLAKKYGVAVFVKRFDTLAIAKAQKKSIEETARDLRYNWFHELTTYHRPPTIERSTPDSRFLTPNWILTAHHADDNIETLLMNIFRGTGIRGLHGILSRQGKLIRPLLFARRNELEAFATEKGLAFVTDHTNAENIYTRNFFRNMIIPLVCEHYPDAKENLLRNIMRFSEAEVLYRQAIDRHKKNLLEQKGNEIHIPVLKLLQAKPLATIIYEIISEFGFTAHQTHEVTELLHSESGKYLRSSSHRIIKNRKWIIISPVPTEIAQTILIDDETRSIEFAGGSLEIEKHQTSNFKHQTSSGIAQLDTAKIVYPLLLRKWATGDYFYPLGMQKKKKLSRFFIDNKLSLTQKEKVWVIESGKKIIWVIGMRIDERCKVTEGTNTILQITFSGKMDNK